MKSLLIIIDPQKDFTTKPGSLYVPGSEKAMEYLNSFIKSRVDEIEDIIVTLDQHPVFHIGHSCFWEENPNPFTLIKPSEYTPRAEISGVDLEDEIMIWPLHCLVGREGSCIDTTLEPALKDWEVTKGKSMKIIRKGENTTDMGYSAFQDNKNLGIVNWEMYDRIYISGVAKDYCVAESVKSLTTSYLSKTIKPILVFLYSGMAAINEESENNKIFENIDRLKKS